MIFKMAAEGSEIVKVTYDQLVKLSERYTQDDQKDNENKIQQGKESK